MSKAIVRSRYKQQTCFFTKIFITFSMYRKSGKCIEGSGYFTVDSILPLEAILPLPLMCV